MSQSSRFLLCRLWQREAAHQTGDWAVGSGTACSGTRAAKSEPTGSAPCGTEATAPTQGAWGCMLGAHGTSCQVHKLVQKLGHSSMASTSSHRDRSSQPATCLEAICHTQTPKTQKRLDAPQRSMFCSNIKRRPAARGQGTHTGTSCKQQFSSSRVTELASQV